MSRTMTVSDSIVVNAPRAAVYELVSDPRATPRWSPENVGASVDGASLHAGDVFVGRNKRGSMRWSTQSVVLAAEPDSRFEFRVQRWGLRTPRVKVAVATWEYRLADADGGTLVTETWTDDRRRMPDWFARIFDLLATRSTFSEFQKRNIATSLRRLKDVVESDAASRPASA